jgi:hypothetical protein
LVLEANASDGLRVQISPLAPITETRRIPMKVNEVFAEVLTEDMAGQFKDKAEAFIKSVKKLNGMEGFFKQAETHQDQLIKILQNCNSAADLKTKINQLGAKIAKEAVHEGIASRIVGASLVSLAGVGAAICAKLIGIYNQMGQPDILAGSHLNAVGGVLFGVIPPLMCAVLAIAIASGKAR